MDLRMQNHRMTRWLGRFVAALLLVLFATASPAQAAVESVAPKSGGTVWYNNWGSGGPFASADAACRAPGTCPVCGSLTYVGTIPNPNVPGDMNCLFFYNPGGGAAGWNTLSGTAIPYSNAVCPTPTVNPTVLYTYNPVTGMCERTAQETCPVDPLTQPPFSDACSTSLEAGKGVDINNKCGTLREPDMVKAAACIADKINALSTPKITYSVPSATIRTAEYQDHLLEIWTKTERLNTIMNSLSYNPETKQACAATYVAINKEKAEHGIKHQPSSSGDAAPHVEHRAIDVPEAVAKALIKQVTVYTTTYTKVNGKNMPTRTITSNVEDYIHSATVNPPACDSNISWGGLFKHYDPVHFQLP